MQIEVKTSKNGNRTYTIDGKALPSVTTILGVLNKPALMPWAVKLTVEAVQELIHDNATHHVIDGTLTLFWEDQEGYMGLENILAEAKKAYRKKSTEAMNIGTKVHEAIENFFHSDCRMKPEEITDEQTRKGFETFLAWTEQHEVEVISFEQVATDGELFAGRYDLLATVNGVKTLIDFKTSTGIFDEYWLQVNAYGSTIPGIEQVAILRLDKTTGELEYVAKDYDPALFSAFKHLAEYYKVIKSGDKA